MVGKIFKIQVLRRLESNNLRLILADTVNMSFIYMFFQPLYRIYVTLNSSQKLLDIDGVMTQFNLNFLKFVKLDGVARLILFLSQIILKISIS